MPLGFLFWLLFVIWVLFGGWSSYQVSQATPGNWRPLGGHFLAAVLIFLLGWKVFGFVIKG